MAEFTCKIELGNDAMRTAEDVARKLRDMANDITHGYPEGSVRDENGNHVGGWSLDLPEEEEDTESVRGPENHCPSLLNFVWNTHHQPARNNEEALAIIVEIAKQEILNDIREGRVPADVASFEDLHGYVDANEYGSLDEGVGDWSENSWWMNEVQDRLNAWLAEGGHRDAPAPTAE